MLEILVKLRHLLSLCSITVLASRGRARDTDNALVSEKNIFCAQHKILWGESLLSNNFLSYSNIFLPVYLD